MNYYLRYMGDYQRDTASLSLLEHGAFSMLLDAYYSNEKPLPKHHETLYRICRAVSATERHAVVRVADQFFPIAEDDLRHNERADREIVKARRKIEIAQQNGRTGGRPKKPTG